MAASNAAVEEPHGNARRSRDRYSFIVRRELSLLPEGNQSSIQVYNESPANVSLSLSPSLPRRASLPSLLPASRHTSSIPSQ
jgi:hypothetical protein